MWSKETDWLCNMKHGMTFELNDATSGWWNILYHLELLIVKNERERVTEWETDRQTDWLTEKNRERDKKDTETHAEAEREKERYRHRHTDWQSENTERDKRETETHTEAEKEKKRYRQTNKLREGYGDSVREFILIWSFFRYHFHQRTWGEE